MTTAVKPSARVAYVPGSVRFTYRAREQRTARCRTWLSANPDMAWCAECLLCGEWLTGSATRGQAAARVTDPRTGHAKYCHALNGCHCSQPHLTAALAARIGVADSYPYELAGWLFALAGGVRRYLPPRLDLNGVPFGGPEFGSGGYRWARYGTEA
jgi:hypothetical protein